jgi:rSAM/selenodomain-associated transferase 2
MNKRATISVIIPTLNEAELIAKRVLDIRKTSEVEVIVADGGSDDNTCQLAASVGAKVLHASPGRSKQMNAGVAVATGDILLFLHADTHLPSDFDDDVRQALSRPGVVAGAFSLCIDAPMPSLRIIERLANWRSRRLQMPYGDQAIFLSKKSFREIGGYSEMPVMEDFELMRRLRKRGQIVISPSCVITSARRWQEVGIWKTTLINQVIIVAYYLGISTSRLARWYSRKESKTRLLQPVLADEEIAYRR